MMIRVQVGDDDMGEIVGRDGLHYCTVCGERTERKIRFPLLDEAGRSEERIVSVECRCRKEERERVENGFRAEESQRRIAELRKLSLMDAKVRSVRFSTYLVNEENQKILKIAKRYVENFDQMLSKSQGLLFWGNVGTGKSYTAAAIANELLDRKIPVIMTSFVKLLNELGGFENDDSAYINKLNAADLLVIDDLGAERGTDFTLEKVYDIIDSRYRSNKPIILTTNLSWNDMKNCTDIRYNRIYDRIFEMCYPVKVDGRSWRKREAVDRYDDMKKILEG